MPGPGDGIDVACFWNQNQPRMAEMQSLEGKRVKFDGMQAQDCEGLKQFKVVSF